MRVCYLSDANNVHTKKWCDYFTSIGYDVHVISLNPGEIENVTIHNLGVDTEKIKNRSPFFKVHYISTISMIKKIIKEIKPDILHAHYASSYGLLGVLAGFKPLIISVWGSDIYDFPKRNFVCKEILKYNLKKANYVFSTSNSMAEETKKYTDKDIFITPFGVDLDQFRKYEKEKDDFIIGTIKTLEKVYGIEYLIRAFKIVSDRYPNVKLHIYGKGSLRESLGKLCSELNISDKVYFGGYIDRTLVPKVFNTFDIAVVPSISESFGVSAIEAQACGVPLIISDVPGLLETSKPGITSLPFESENYEDLANKIEILIKDKNLREEMSKNSISFIRDNYDLKTNFHSIANIYNKIMKENNIK